MWRNWSPHTVLVGMLIGVIAMKNSMEVSQKKKKKKDCHMIQQLYFWVYSQKNWHQDLRGIFEFLCSLQHNLQPIARLCKQFACPSMDKLIKKMWYYTYNGILAFKKEIPVICESTEETEGHYAKWNKPVTESQTQHESI